MPKDPPRNQPNYKIGGYHLNEYEFEQNKGAITKEEIQLPRSEQNSEEANLQEEIANSADDINSSEKTD